MPDTTEPLSRTYPARNIIGAATLVFSPPLDGHGPGEPESAHHVLLMQAATLEALPLSRQGAILGDIRPHQFPVGDPTGKAVPTQLGKPASVPQS